ncbi:MAG: protein kinase [Deltaproteobacteria bacterium]|nr:protein kinase [Deltaproteobacteria bacterium]
MGWEGSNPPRGSLIGSVLDGRYRVDQEIGRGGMGRVYRGHQLSVRRDVAIKVLSLEGEALETAKVRFEIEAQVIATLRSPYTVKLIDFGRIPGEPETLYLVTELLSGRSLADVVRDGPLKVPRLLHFLRQITESLVEAHEREIVHRDLKPANIFIESVGGREQVKVLDFGIAKLAEQPKLTHTNATIGTPAYMSPEQAQNHPLNGSSDVYSMGVVAYECLTGVVPFTSDSAVGVMLKHVRDAPVPPSARHPAARIPSPVEDLVLRMLAKDPEARPRNAIALRNELEQIADRMGAGAAADSVRTVVDASLSPASPGDPVDMADSVADTLIRLESPPTGSDVATTPPTKKVEPPRVEPTITKDQASHPAPRPTRVPVGWLLVVGAAAAGAAALGLGALYPSTPQLGRPPQAEAPEHARLPTRGSGTEKAIAPDASLPEIAAPPPVRTQPKRKAGPSPTDLTVCNPESGVICP